MYIDNKFYLYHVEHSYESQNDEDNNMYGGSWLPRLNDDCIQDGQIDFVKLMDKYGYTLIDDCCNKWGYLRVARAINHPGG